MVKETVERVVFVYGKSLYNDICYKYTANAMVHYLKKSADLMGIFSKKTSDKLKTLYLSLASPFPALFPLF